MGKGEGYCKVVAIVRGESLENVEQRLQQLGVPGITVTCVKGYGEYADFYSRDCMTEHVRVEIFTSAARAENVAQGIIDAAHSGVAGDGIVAVLPVSKIYRIRQRAEIRPEQFE
ncbi:MAG: P-II family nitrogen regulator [Gammaproteobacteria bacterium]|nr:P-II family nitrogen regulator [Gammaproteobacteria bacterium]